MKRARLVLACLVPLLVGFGSGGESTADDVRILREATRLLRDPGDWNRSCERDPRVAPGKHSLFTALRHATLEVAGTFEPGRLALEAVRARIPDPDGLFEHPLRDFNNTRSHGEVLCLLAAALADVEERLYFETHPGGPALVGLRSNALIELELRALARRWPRWCVLESIGETVQGRDLWLLRITDPDSTEPRRGVWIDGGIHGCEVASSEVVVGLAESLAADLEACEPPVWLTRVELFLVPVVNPDARALCKRPPYAVQRANLQPFDDDGDGRTDEEVYADLNGDGRIGSLHGRAGEQAYEGTDSDGDGRYGEDLPGGIDLNRDFPVRSREREAGFEPQPETRSVCRFFERNPHIELALSYHTSRDMFITPYATERIDADYVALADLYLEHFPHGDVWHLSVEPDRYGIARPREGMNVEWFHFERGARAVILEIGPNDFRSSRKLAETGISGLKAMSFPPGRYARDVETRLEHTIEAVRRDHARFLRRVIGAETVR